MPHSAEGKRGALPLPLRGALPPAPPGRGMIPLHPHPRFRAGKSPPVTGFEAAEEPPFRGAQAQPEKRQGRPEEDGTGKEKEYRNKPEQEGAGKTRRRESA